MKVLMVSSSGGVLLDLLALKPWWKHHETTWAVVPAMDTRTALAQLSVCWVREQRFQRPFGLVWGFFEAWKVLRSLRPDVIVSAGSGVAIAFFVLAKLLQIPTFWVETFNFVEQSAVSGKICSRLSSEILLQRCSMLRANPRGIVLGELY